MKYFEDISIKNYKGIVEGHLAELGKINIICGRNNSGKSTILEAISNSKVSLSRKLNNLSYDFIQDNISSEFMQYNDFEDDILRVRFKTDNNRPFHLSKIFIEKLIQEIQIFIDGEEIVWNEELLLKSFFEYAKKKGTLEFNDYEFDYDGSIASVINGETSDEPNIRFIINLLFKFTGKKSLIVAKRKPDISIPFDKFKEKKEVIKYIFESKGQLHTSEEFLKFQQLKKEFLSLSGGFDFDVVIENDTIELYFTNKNGIWIKAEDSGLGFRDLLYILSTVILLDLDVILIEEPESHLNPDLQRKLLHYFKFETNKQYFIATHSNVFLDTSYVDKIYHTTYNEFIELTDKTSKAIILNDLGYSTFDNLFADLLILVEGKTDVPIFEEFLTKLGILNRFSIKILPLGGVTNMPDVNLNVLKENYNKIIAVVDGDKNQGSIRAKSKLKAECNILNINYIELLGYGIENYLSINAYKQFYRLQLPHHIDLQTNIAIQIPNHSKNNNRTLANLMTHHEIEATGDLYDLLLEIQEICKSLPEKI